MMTNGAFLIYKKGEHAREREREREREKARAVGVISVCDPGSWTPCSTLINGERLADCYYEYRMHLRF